MSIQDQIQALEALAALDEQLAQIESEIGLERAQLGDKRLHRDELAQRYATSRDSIVHMERTRNELITEARQMGLQIERSREKLGRSRTEREVNAAQRELEELRKLFRDRENEVQRLLTLIEQARTGLVSLEEQQAALALQLGEGEGVTERRLDQLEAQAKSLGSAREGSIVKLPPVLYRRYETVRKRRGTGIAHTTSGTCSACHITFSPMFFQTMRREPKFEQCPSCSRILYYRVPVAEPTDAENNG